jgi:hypothetical protein
MHVEPTTTPPEAMEISPPLLTVTVLFTDLHHTLAALRTAIGLGRSLHASLRVLMPIEVPYRLPLSEPQVDCRILQRRLSTALDQSDIPARIETVYCRDRAEAVERALAPHSVVVVCCRKPWLFDSGYRLSRRLSMLGHNVIDAPLGKGD